MSCQVIDPAEALSNALLSVQTESRSGSSTGIDTLQRLIALSQAWPGPLTPDLRSDLDAICRKLAITGTLLAEYQAAWKPASEKKELPESGWNLLAATLVAWSNVPEQMGADGRGLSAKLLDAACRTLECADIHDSIRKLVDERLDGIEVPEASENAVFESAPVASNTLRTLPLTVLAYEGPCVRAYLSMMRRAGLRPERIVLLVLSEHPGTRKPVGSWFPGRLRSWYAEKTQEHALNFWPRRIQASHPELVRSIAKGLEPVIDRPAELFREMYGPFRYEAYADRVERLAVRDLKDDALVRALEQLAPTTVLFTGGGILPGKVIDLPGLRFLHVHPGHLPYVRGADGLLWSTLVRGQPAMSCFYLANGLDTGEIAAVRDYPALAFSTPASNRPDDQTCYRAIFSFVDPLLRADLLVRVLARTDDPQRLPTTRQNETEGVTYHFMHQALRTRVLAHLFPQA